MRLPESHCFLPATAILQGCSTLFRALRDSSPLAETNPTAPPWTEFHRSVWKVDWICGTSIASRWLACSGTVFLLLVFQVLGEALSKKGALLRQQISLSASTMIWFIVLITSKTYSGDITGIDGLKSTWLYWGMCLLRVINSFIDKFSSSISLNSFTQNFQNHSHRVVCGDIQFKLPWF